MQIIKIKNSINCFKGQLKVSSNKSSKVDRFKFTSRKTHLGFTLDIKLCVR